VTTTAAPAVLYTKTGCPYCAAQREALVARGVAWREVNVSERPETIPELLKVTHGRRIVPVLVSGARIEIAPAGGSSF
jgi:glutaredoxin 3